MWTTEHAEVTTATAEAVWQVVADVPHWPTWNPGYAAATSRRSCEQGHHGDGDPHSSLGPAGPGCASDSSIGSSRSAMARPR